MLCPLPIVEQLIPVERRPLDYQSERPRRQMSRECRECLNFDERLIIPVDRMEMWWTMVIEEHLDHNSEEPGNLRHRWLLVSTKGKHPLDAGGLPEDKVSLGKDQSGRPKPIHQPHQCALS